MAKQIFYTICILFVIVFQNFGNNSYYVALNGSDKNPGTKQKPLATVQKAIDLAKTSISKTDVFIHGGVYYLNKGIQIDTYDQNSSLTFSAMQGEEVVFHGGISLSAKDFRKISDQKVGNRLPAEVRDKVLQINIKKYGIQKFDGIKHHGFGIIPEPAPNELFVNGQPQTIARYPNDSTLKIGKVYFKGSVPRVGDFTNKGAIFGFHDNRILNWAKADDVWIHGKFSYGFCDEHLKLKNIDAEKKTIELLQPHLYGVFTGMLEYVDPKKSEEKAGLTVRGYYAYNLLEEIDQPGEYFIDRKNGILYYYPDYNFKNQKIELSVLEEPLLTIKNSKNIVVNAIKFTSGRGMGILLENCESVDIQNCKLNSFGTVAISLGHPLRNNTNGFLQDGSPKQWQHTSDNFNINIKSCEIFNTGCGGVILDGGNRRTLEPSGNRVEFCLFQNTDRINQSYSPAIKMFGVGQVVANCSFKKNRHQSISFLGNDHVIEYCRFENICYDADDMGAIYTGRDPSSRGTVIRYNYFKNILSKSPQTSMCGVYIDDGSGGVVVHDNVFYKTGNPGHFGNFGAVFINTGFDNRIFNNTFIDCKTAVGHNSATEKDWLKLLNGPLLQFRMYEDVNVRSEVYRQKYPELVQYENNTSRRLNYMEYNWLIGTQIVSFGDFALRKNTSLSISPLSPEEFDYSTLKVKYPDFNMLDIQKTGHFKK